MRRFHRHPLMWSLSLMSGVAVVGLTIWPSAPLATLFSWNGPWVAQVTTSNPLDSVEMAQLGTLRAAGALDLAGLAPLNLNEAQATTCLTDLRAWYDANRAEVSAAQRSVADAAAQLRAAESAFATGQGDGGTVESARTALQAAQAAWTAIVQSCRAASLKSLGQEVVAIADRIYGNRQERWTLPYDVVPFEEGEATQLVAAISQYQQRRSMRATREARATEVARFAAERDAAIGANGVETLETLSGYLATATRVALAAELEVFPPSGEELG